MIRKNLIKEKKGISPIIATLLLILIAIAAGVIVYAYVIGFIGNSTTNTGNSTSVVSIDNACVSSSTTGCGGGAFSIVVRNVGSTTINGQAAVYFTDITASSTPDYSGTVTCSASNNGPGTTFTCSGATGGSWSSTVQAGDTITVKIVVSDGGSATISVKAI